MAILCMYLTMNRTEHIPFLRVAAARGFLVYMTMPALAVNGKENLLDSFDWIGLNDGQADHEAREVLLLPHTKYAHDYLHHVNSQRVSESKPDPLDFQSNPNLLLEALEAGQSEGAAHLGPWINPPTEAQTPTHTE